MDHMKKSSLATALKQNRAHLRVVRAGSVPEHSSHSVRAVPSRRSTYFGLSILRPPSTNVLRILQGAGADGLCRNEISERMVTATPDMSMSWLLDRMERAEDDRRQVSTYITKSGMELLEILERANTRFPGATL